MTTTATPRGPGRPKADAALDSRQALIDAAKELFSRHSFGAVSNKRIAEAAGVNPAMIHYHFRGKDDLLATAFREAAEPLLEQLAQLSVKSAGGLDIRRVFEIYMGTLAAHTWLPGMIVRHVLPPSGHLQPLVVEAIRGRVAPTLRRVIENGQQAGDLRPDLDPMRTTISLVSLALFPFVAAPLISKVFGFEPTPGAVDDLIEHTVTLFKHGTVEVDSDV